MKNITLMTLSVFTSFIMNAQPVRDLERYNFYEYIFIVDNLPQNILSNEVHEYYYRNLSQKQYRVKYQFIDPKAKQRIINAISRDAKSGYLFVNQRISERVNNIEDRLIVQYTYNGTPVESAEEVKRLVRLRRKQISVCDVEVGLNQGIVSVYIYDGKSRLNQ